MTLITIIGYICLAWSVFTLVMGTMSLDSEHTINVWKMSGLFMIVAVICLNER